MRRKRFTEEQVISILKESAAGSKTEELCRRHGISQYTFYRWKGKYADMEISDVCRLKELSREHLQARPPDLRTGVLQGGALHCRAWSPRRNLLIGPPC